MKLSISNIGWAAEQDAEVYDLMKRFSFSGLEIAPTRIFPENPYEKLDAAREWAQMLKQQHGFCIPSMQSIWFGRQERIFGTADEREILLDYTKKAIDFAAAIDCKNLVEHSRTGPIRRSAWNFSVPSAITHCAGER